MENKMVRIFSAGLIVLELSPFSTDIMESCQHDISKSVPARSLKLGMPTGDDE